MGDGNDVFVKTVIANIFHSSVVTSVTIIENKSLSKFESKLQNMKEKNKPKRKDKTPKFEFYLYNDAGRIIKQYLSIHEIQQILLQQSQNLGKRKLKLLQHF